MKRGAEKRWSVLPQVRDFADEQLRKPRVGAPHLPGNLVIAEGKELFRRVEDFQDS